MLAIAKLRIRFSTNCDCLPRPNWSFDPGSSVDCAPIAVGIDIYNLTNTDVATGFNQTFSPTSTTWLTPTSIQPARYARISVQVDF